MKPVLIKSSRGVIIYSTKVNDKGNLCGFRVVSNFHKNDPTDTYTTLVDAEKKMEHLIGSQNN